jgi:hypothetical protein
VRLEEAAIDGAGRRGLVTVSRAELDALRAEVRRLRREVGRSVARARIESDPGPGDGSLTMSRSELAEAWGISE